MFERTHPTKHDLSVENLRSSHIIVYRVQSILTQKQSTMASSVAPAATETENDLSYPHHRTYQLHICGLFNVKHNRMDNPYPQNQEFSKAELLTVTPRDVKRYLLLKAFRQPDVDLNDPAVCSTERHADSLKKYKQAIFWFMPNKNVAWIEGVGGNPTRHVSVTNVIKKVGDLEMKGMGVDPNDKRPYSEAEFCSPTA